MRMTAVLLAAILLPSVSTAADCSFVLWAEDSWLQTGRDYSVSWTLIQTESSLAQCRAGLDAKIESQAEALTKDDNAGKVEIKSNIVSSNYVSEDKKFFSFHSIRYLCVPDKIDPRPKVR